MSAWSSALTRDAFSRQTFNVKILSASREMKTEALTMYNVMPGRKMRET